MNIQLIMKEMNGETDTNQHGWLNETFKSILDGEMGEIVLDNESESGADDKDYARSSSLPSVTHPTPTNHNKHSEPP